MNFLEAFDELEHLQEAGEPGQRSYKQFLIFLLKYLGGNDYHDHEDWFLHHVNGDHDKNNSFKNLVLMHPDSHRVLHGKVKNKDKPDYARRLEVEFKTPTRRGGKKYEYIPIGREIEEKLEELRKAALKVAC